MNNILNDKEFLKKLDNTKEKRTYIRIISLDNKNNPLEMLEGRATGGSVNLDGASAVRRSCSLSLIAFEDKKFVEGQIIPITDVYWGLKNRFKLEVGIENLIEPKYPNIIWFKQGHFVINNFSKSININGGININISGQDKMALLNGTFGGQFLSEIDFGTEEEIDEWGNVIIHKIPIYNIIKNALQVYAQEPLENIIINDLDEENAWELWDYRGEEPMYMLGSTNIENTLQIQNMILNQETLVINSNKITSGEKDQGYKYFYKAYDGIKSTSEGYTYLLREGSRNDDDQTTGMKINWTTETIEHNFSFDYLDADGKHLPFSISSNIEFQSGGTTNSISVQIAKLPVSNDTTIYIKFNDKFNTLYSNKDIIVDNFGYDFSFVGITENMIELKPSDLSCFRDSDWMDRLYQNAAEDDDALYILTFQKDVYTIVPKKFIDAPIKLEFIDVQSLNKIQEYIIPGNIFELLPDNSNLLYKISEIPQYYSLNTLDPTYNNNSTTVILPGGTEEYKVAKIEYGETAGYHATDLVYNTDLILKAGETITSLLDKLKNMLSNFEYFYDINGRFVFQKKKDYIQELFSPIDGNIINPTMTISPYEYKFEDTKLFTAISNSPKIDNVKNDFVVWGSKKSGSNNIPFHARCAIHEKPQIYTTQPYYEKRELTYLQRIPYTSGKPFVQQEDGSFRIEYNEIFDVNPSHTIELSYDDNYKSSIPFIIPRGRYIMKITTNGDLTNLFNTGSIKLYGEKTNGQTTLSNLINTFQIIKEEDNYILSSYIYTHEKNYDKLFLELSKLESSSETEIIIESFTIKWYPATKKYNLIETDNNSETDDNLYYLKNQIYWKNVDVLYSNQAKKDGALLPNEPGTYYNLIPSKTYKIKESSYKNQEGIETEWQEIIYQMAIDYYRHNMESDFLNNVDTNNIYEVNGNDVHLYPNGKTGYEQYYQDLQAFWRLLYNPEAAAANYCSLTYEYYPEDSNYRYWNKYIHSDPSKLPYWLAFLDLGGAELSKYSISEIGQRPKVINENNINSIYYKEIPEVQFVISPEEIIDTDTSYTPLQIQKNMEALFSRSSQGLSAIEKINELLYQHSCCSEGLSLTSIPIWYLQPNTRIYVEGQGDYTLDKIQYNLNYNGMMNLTCTKVIKQIF